MLLTFGFVVLLNSHAPGLTATAVKPPAMVAKGPSEVFRGRVVRRVNPKEKRKLIALTFDDGPQKDTTAYLLNLLKSHKAKATFFMLGSRVKAYPRLSKRISEEGHEVGNHSWSHSYKELSSEQVVREVDGTTNLIEKATGQRTTLFRPPGGFLNTAMAHRAKDQNYVIVMWSRTAADTAPTITSTALAQRVLGQARNGDIVLLHDGGPHQLAKRKAWPLILKGLKERGFEMVTVSELLSATQPKKTVSRRKGVMPSDHKESQLTVPSKSNSFSAQEG